MIRSNRARGTSRRTVALSLVLLTGAAVASTASAHHPQHRRRHRPHPLPNGRLRPAPAERAPQRGRHRHVGLGRAARARALRPVRRHLVRLRRTDAHDAAAGPDLGQNGVRPAAMTTGRRRPSPNSEWLGDSPPPDPTPWRRHQRAHRASGRDLRCGGHKYPSTERRSGNIMSPCRFARSAPWSSAGATTCSPRPGCHRSSRWCARAPWSRSTNSAMPSGATGHQPRTARSSKAVSCGCDASSARTR